MKTKLGEILTHFMQELRKNIRIEDHELKGRWETFKKELGSIYDILLANGNLRVHDPESGGIFRGHIQSRTQNKEIWDKKFKGLLCRKENLNGEVGYSRAMFNKKFLDVKNSMDDSTERMALIAYEAPLLRKITDKLNREIDSKFAKCDLIGLHNNSIAPIEVKVEPDLYSTYLPHALVESFAYGYYINRHLQDSNIGLINSEIHLCLDQFNFDINMHIGDSYNVEYFVAAPVDYFATYFLGGEKSQKWYELRINEVLRLEDILLNNKSTEPKFGGYLTIDQSKTDIVNGIDSQSNNCYPEFDKSTIAVKKYSDIVSIKNEIEAS
jgi:hypothetical protein